MKQALVLNERDTKRVLTHISRSTYAKRNRAMFQLSWLAGMRVGEIAALTVDDVMTSNGEIVKEIRLRAEQTKGQKGRAVFLSDKLRRELADYIPTLAHSAPSRPLIYSQRGYGRFSNGTLCMLFASIYQQAGLRTSSHSGRRTYATRLNEKGVGMRTIQKLMGHKHIGTTALYCDVSDDTLRKAVELV